jgi:hypothetical protein
MVKRGIHIPKMAYMVTLRAISLVLIVLIVQLAWVWHVHPLGSTNVSRACWTEYALSVNPGNGPPVTLSGKCRDELTASDAANARQTHQFQEWLVIIAVGFLTTYAANKWFARYAEGVEKVTNGKLSGINVALALMVLPYSVGAAIVQNGINQSSGNIQS